MLHSTFISLRLPESELRPDVHPHFVNATRAIGLDDEFLASKEFQNGFGLRSIVSQALSQALFIVIAANDKLATADIAGIDRCGAVVNQVVVQSTLTAESACQHSFKHDFVRNDDVDHRVNVIAFEKELGLNSRPGKTVEDETEVPVVLGQTVANDLFDGLVVNHPSIGDQSLDSRSEFRVRLNVPTKDVAHGDMNDLEVLL